MIFLLLTLAITITATPSPKIQNVYPHTVIVCSEKEGGEELSTLWIRQKLTLEGLPTLTQEEITYRLSQKQRRNWRSKLAISISLASLATSTIISSPSFNIDKNVINKLLVLHAIARPVGEVLQQASSIPPPPPIPASVTCRPCSALVLLGFKPRVVSIRQIKSESQLSAIDESNILKWNNK